MDHIRIATQLSFQNVPKEDISEYIRAGLRLNKEIGSDGADFSTTLLSLTSDDWKREAEQALHLARLFGCEAAILKERSPSCGCGEIYDGTFSGALTPGAGVTAELFKAEGIPVYGESRVAELI